MNARMILASVAGAMLLASPMAASASSTHSTKHATTTSKDTCKGLKGDALKDCKAKASADKKAAKAK